MILTKLLSRDRALSFPITAFLNSISSTLQFGIKNIYANVKFVYEVLKNGQTIVICSTATRCVEPQHKSLLLAKVLSRDRALYFPFTAFRYSISSTLQFGIKKNHIRQRKVCLWRAQKRPNGRQCSTATRCAELQHKRLLLAWAKDPLWNLWFGVFNAWFNSIFQSCCLTWHSSCKMSLFTFLNLHRS